MRKRIIVPTDFSRTSNNAYRYARELAEEYNARLEVIHVYSGTFSTGEVPALIPLQGITEGLETRLQKFITLYPNKEEGVIKTELQVETELVIGGVVNIITRKSVEEDVFMIVMGATGEHDAVDRLFGSVSSHVAQKASCPVLLVPSNASYAPFQQILYASNFESADKESIGKIKKMASLFQAGIYFIHVNEGKEQEDFTETRSRIINRLFEDSNPAFSFSMESVEADSVLEGLSAYTRQNEIDMMVLVNRQRGFWDSLLGHSLTKKMALCPEAPVLIDHLK